MTNQTEQTAQAVMLIHPETAKNALRDFKSVFEVTQEQYAKTGDGSARQWIENYHSTIVRVLRHFAAQPQAQAVDVEAISALLDAIWHYLINAKLCGVAPAWESIFARIAQMQKLLAASPAPVVPDVAGYQLKTPDGWGLFLWSEAEMATEAREEEFRPLYTIPPAQHQADARTDGGGDKSFGEWDEALVLGEIYNLAAEFENDPKQALACIFEFLSLRDHHRLLASKPLAPAVADGGGDVLDFIEYESIDLRCVDVPTGGDDSDTSWRVIQHHMDEPVERIIGYGSTPLKALKEAGYKPRQAPAAAQDGVRDVNSMVAAVYVPVLNAADAMADSIDRIMTPDYPDILQVRDKYRAARKSASGDLKAEGE